MSFCPWCQNDIIVGDRESVAELLKDGRIKAASFAAHVQTCEGAPESVKGAYRT